MKTRRRRSRVIAGFALIAASAAVASAMFGPLAATAAPAPLHAAIGSSGVMAQLPVAQTAERTPLRLAIAKPRTHAGALATATDRGTAVALAASGVTGDPAAQREVIGSALGTWWLGYTSAGSRTRGQPLTDALA